MYIYAYDKSGYSIMQYIPCVNQTIHILIDVSLSGMTLAAIVGMIMSLVFYAFDKFHLSNDA